jgi:ubiquinone/menaquinone biosynthesis C-methylase UbiE
MYLPDLTDVLSPQDETAPDPDAFVADEFVADASVADAVASPVTTGEFDDPARYDLEYGWTTADLPFYAALADAADGPVLDIATGTGRIALALAAQGHEVTAVDISDAMIEYAQTKPGAQDVTWVTQDISSFKPKQKFALAIVGGNAFGQFLSNADRSAALSALYRALRPGATLAIALRFPQASDLARRGDVVEAWHTYLDAEGREVLVSGTSHYDPVAQVMHHTTYRTFAFDGTPAAPTCVVAVRQHFPAELEAALTTARFEVVGQYADFWETPLHADATHMVIVARKPERDRRSA